MQKLSESARSVKLCVHFITYFVLRNRPLFGSVDLSVFTNKNVY